MERLREIDAIRKEIARNQAGLNAALYHFDEAKKTECRENIRRLNERLNRLFDDTKTSKSNSR